MNADLNDSKKKLGDISGIKEEEELEEQSHRPGKQSQSRDIIIIPDQDLLLDGKPDSQQIQKFLIEKEQQKQQLMLQKLESETDPPCQIQGANDQGEGQTCTQDVPVATNLPGELEVPDQQIKTD